MTSPKNTSRTTPHSGDPVQPKAKQPPITVRSVQGDESAMTAAPAAIPATPSDSQKILETLADSDSRYLRIPVEKLPSKGIFYDFTALSIRKFAWTALKKVSRAQATSNFRTLCEVVNESIDRDLFNMTTGDFWYLMYWHRINSYLSAPLDITFQCTNLAHVAATMLPEDDEMYQHPSTLEGVVTLQKSNLQIEYIQDEQALADHIQQIYAAYSIVPDATRLKDLVENIEIMDRLSGLEAFKAEMREATDESNPVAVAVSVSDKVLESADEESLNDYASLLADVHGTTLAEKKAWLMQYTDDHDIGYELKVDFDTFIELSAHGVRESVTTTCRGCKGSAEGIISANALKFFPGLL